MRTLVWIAIANAFVACIPAVSGLSPNQTPHAVFHDSFDDIPAIQANWTAVTPSVVGASAEFENSATRLSMPRDGDGDVVLRHRFNAYRLRGKRVRVSARARTDAPRASYAWARVVVTPADAPPSYADRADTRAVNAAAWMELRVVIDVDPAAATGEISLTLHGPGRAWFDDVAIDIVGDSPHRPAVHLSRQQLDNVVVFSRAAALVHYLHPSDQAADLDWNEFLPAAIDRVLHAADGAALVNELRSLFAPIAPTVTFSTRASPGVPITLLNSAGDRLARWWRLGLGPTTPYSGYREGRDEEGVADIEEGVTARVAKAQDCKVVHVHAATRRLTETGKAWVFTQFLRPGRQYTDVEEPIVPGVHEVMLTKEVPPDTQQIRIGVRASGRTSIVLEALSLECESGILAVVDLAGESWIAKGWPHLYAWNIGTCGSSICATLSRKPYETTFVPDRDTLDTELGAGVSIRLPLAVWADAQRTLPVPVAKPARGDFTIGDLPTRLATIASAWGTLSIFYPYFSDQQTNWLTALSPALVEAASAGSPADTHAALGHLITSLHDNHARANHPTDVVSGLLPLAFRRFSDKIVVIGGLPEYMKMIAPGMEVIALDGIPVRTLYDRTESLVSAATPGWRASFTEFNLGVGPQGAFRRLQFRTANGAIIERLLPLVSRDLYAGSIRDPRPKTGTEVAPGIYYVDFDTLSSSAWSTWLPTLQRARGLVFDFRGYLSSGAFVSLAHLTDQPLLGPRMQIPLVGPQGIQQPPTQWNIRPAQPRLGMPVVVLIDGQSISAVETFLQIFRDHHLGYIVGEPSGGTNGDMNTFSVPGGFSVRFTGLRVSGADNTAIQGRGIVPDQVVHPTLDGVRAGRDEILGAGVAVAQRLAPK